MKHTPIELTARHATIVSATAFQHGLRLTFGENIEEASRYHTAVFLPVGVLERLRKVLDDSIAAIEKLKPDAVQD